MSILITGSTGFLGQQLVSKFAKQGKSLILLARDSRRGKQILKSYLDTLQNQNLAPSCQVLIGDITKLDLGLEDVPKIDCVIHCAALLDLGGKREDEVWKVNVDGTRNVVKFCQWHGISPLVFISTAYTQGRNAYEVSKRTCERDIAASGIKYTILRPSIVIGSPENPGTDQAINHAALAIAKVHRKAETARRKVQDTLALPAIELGARIRGDPQATLNVIPVELVADQIIDLGKAEGIYWVTNPNPPLLEEVADEVGKALGLNIQLVKEFKPSPPELLLQKFLTPFLPYLQGEPHFPTVVDKGFRLPRGYIRDMVSSFLFSSPT